ncbi:MAG: hypothetical protein ACUBOA_04835 [Candidatus Loosdrechtia sp.]|uniref:hypothetical protein n=1 Tax=Candidatus Loosdrechtia sp. TaxID=3101272 RepID=UPI003A690D6A|nr:MAG: hypothetical protein QY305_14375 [Candidatus Jettenia sp. AMX2]
MIYHELLYSRSLTKDYRWMIIPPKISRESLKALNQLYNFYEKHKGAFNKSPVPPFYCFNHPEAIFLVSCGLSDYKDKEGRDIYFLQGMSASNKYKRHFWLILPWILNNFTGNYLLNPWSKLDFRSADNLVRHASGEYSLKIDQLTESLAELAKTQKSIPENITGNRSAFISYDKEGLKELTRLISSTYHDCMDFAFGATPEMVSTFNFRIIAKAEGRSTVKNTGTRTAQINPLPSHVREGVVRESVYDIDRFDPKKKRNHLHNHNNAKRLHDKKKPPGENNSSHLFHQFLPRVVSLFEIGKKLKQRFRGK